MVIRSFYFCFLIAIVLMQGCTSTNTGINHNKSISSHYALPTTYQEHRHQQQFFTSSDDLTLAYTDHGQGKTLVLIHGVPTSSWMYRKMIPALQDNFRVITVDLVGYGSSDKPEQGVAYNNSRQAERISQLLKHLDVKQYSLLFHDMGGLVAWELLAQQTKAVDNLIALNTIVRKEGFNHPEFNNKFMTRIMTDAFSNQLTSAAVLRKTFSNMGLGAHALTEQECRGYVLPMREGSNHALFNFYNQLNDDLYTQLDNNRFLFERFTGKTLIFWGEQDKVLTTQQIPFLQEHLKIPASNIHTYPNNAHFLAEEIPEILTTEIIDFLR